MNVTSLAPEESVETKRAVEQLMRPIRIAMLKFMVNGGVLKLQTGNSVFYSARDATNVTKPFDPTLSGKFTTTQPPNPVDYGSPTSVTAEYRQGYYDNPRGKFTQMALSEQKRAESLLKNQAVWNVYNFSLTPENVLSRFDLTKHFLGSTTMAGVAAAHPAPVISGLLGAKAVDKGTEMATGQPWGEYMSSTVGGQSEAWDVANPGYFAFPAGKAAIAAGKFSAEATTRFINDLANFNQTGQIGRLALKPNTNYYYRNIGNTDVGLKQAVEENAILPKKYDPSDKGTPIVGKDGKQLTNKFGEPMYLKPHAYQYAFFGHQGKYPPSRYAGKYYFGVDGSELQMKKAFKNHWGNLHVDAQGNPATIPFDNPAVHSYKTLFTTGNKKIGWEQNKNKIWAKYAPESTESLRPSFITMPSGQVIALPPMESTTTSNVPVVRPSNYLQALVKYPPETMSKWQMGLTGFEAWDNIYKRIMSGDVNMAGLTSMSMNVGSGFSNTPPPPVQNGNLSGWWDEINNARKMAADYINEVKDERVAKMEAAYPEWMNKNSEYRKQVDTYLANKDATSEYPIALSDNYPTPSQVDDLLNYIEKNEDVYRDFIEFIQPYYGTNVQSAVYDFLDKPFEKESIKGLHSSSPSGFNWIDIIRNNPNKYELLQEIIHERLHGSTSYMREVGWPKDDFIALASPYDVSPKVLKEFDDLFTKRFLKQGDNYDVTVSPFNKNMRYPGNNEMSELGTVYGNIQVELQKRRGIKRGNITANDVLNVFRDAGDVGFGYHKTFSNLKEGAAEKLADLFNKHGVLILPASILTSQSQTKDGI